MTYANNVKSKKMLKNKTAKRLKRWLISTEKIFSRLDKYVLDVADNESHRIFIDRGAKVLFVAHVDTVRIPRMRRTTKDFIVGQGFDDRLGCLLAYDLSGELGADLLLTDHEEKCGTTGRFHKLKDYNWIVEFDREGTDVVTYDLDSPEFRELLREHWEIGFGSYSDISELKTDACCFNLGIGHYDSHGKKAYVNVREMEEQIAKFKRFYADHKDMKYTRIERPKYDKFWTEDIMICEFCGMNYGTQIFDTAVCADCFEVMTENFYGYNPKRLSEMVIEDIE